MAMHIHAYIHATRQSATYKLIAFNLPAATKSANVCGVYLIKMNK